MPAGGQRLRRVRRGRRRRSRCRPSRRWRSPTTTAPPSSPARSSCSPRSSRTSRTSPSASARGEGFGWHEHDHDLFEGTERFFRPGYLANLVESWLPSLDGVVEKLEAGARVADIGCGHGASTILMAQAYPALDVRRLRLPRGLDRGRAPRRRARRRRRPRHVRGRGRQGLLAGGPYDLVCVFDALHDMGDPVGAARHVRSPARRRRHVAGRRAVRRRRASRTTSTPSGACSTRPRRCSARPPR